MSELVKYDGDLAYSEYERDRAEERLADEKKKRELLYRRNHGITVIASWLVEQNVVTIWVHDERVNDSAEFIVPNSEVLTWHEHPFAHPDANIRAYSQSDNGS
jgi:hypothetical protein